MQLFVNDLTVMDFSYLCPKRGMVGESWIVDVVLDGALNDESMIEDFSLVKKNLKRLIDGYVDHKLLVPVEYKDTHLRRDDNDRVEVVFNTENKQTFALFCPDDAYAFIYSDSITMASVGAYLKEVIATHLPENVNGLHLSLRNEVINTPYYHYTHGLKKHDGNCQRIAHGHRSKIDIYRNGAHCEQSEKQWAQRWQDIYVASQDDALPPSSLTMQFAVPESDYVCFAYEASQGWFEIVLPASACEVISTDSTVECLAQFIYEQQCEQYPDDQFRVVAYEGVGKGAMVGN
ncbi:6-carboxytetrahydropterin synthase [Alteromonas sp. 5E99-2]|uniref:6-carboxytetrahydropterin synthase n=1 Tax=Alteromonas sp. 5E99-2 TaxID=2817683 RepID=UPI001A986F9D|nr:6-carboxytetrahydropterin synthase [Alteromonas sp. 5E99-2]MBO1255537.1 6-carboxytetrahydropterin synthase [Alteromonas sp. 5E99-2]